MNLKIVENKRESKYNAKVVLDNNITKVLYKGSLFNIDESSISCYNKIILYAKLDNGYWKPWHKSERTAPYLKDDYKLVDKWWQSVKPGLLVRGFIKDNEFIIDDVKHD